MAGLGAGRPTPGASPRFQVDAGQQGPPGDPRLLLSGIVPGQAVSVDDEGNAVGLDITTTGSPSPIDAAAGTASLRTLGTGATQAAAGTAPAVAQAAATAAAATDATTKANAAQAAAIQRANHTGTQSVSTITGTLPIAQVPTGTTGSTVALGNAPATAQAAAISAAATDATTKANAAQAAAIQRANHTGTQSISTVTGTVPIAQIPTGTTGSTVALGSDPAAAQAAAIAAAATDATTKANAAAAASIPTTQKGAASGVAPLNSSSLVAPAYLGTGTASSTTYLRGDGTYATPPGSGGSSTSTYALTLSKPGSLSASTGLVRVPIPVASTLVGTWAAISQAADANVIADLNIGGTTAYTTQANRPKILAGAFSSTALAAPNVTALAAGSYLTLDVDQTGGALPGEDLVVTVLLTTP